MNINITGRHVEITDELRDHSQSRIEREFSEFKHYRIENVHVILNIEKHRHIAELVVKAPHQSIVEAKAEGHDMYASIDDAIAKCVKQMRKWLDKVQDHHKGIKKTL
jgi:putative sigma-54 modulation protein